MDCSESYSKPAISNAFPESNYFSEIPISNFVGLINKVKLLYFQRRLALQTVSKASNLLSCLVKHRNLQRSISAF